MKLTFYILVIVAAASYFFGEIQWEPASIKYETPWTFPKNIGFQWKQSRGLCNMELTPQMCTNWSYISCHYIYPASHSWNPGQGLAVCVCGRRRVYSPAWSRIYTAQSSPENPKSRLEEENFENVAIEWIAG